MTDTQGTKDLGQQIQAILDAAYPSDEPGGAAVVTQNGKVIFRGAAGLANLELGVPIRPEMVFRLGSITKQFTAVAVLMLIQRGALSLQDEITKFLPDYPTQGHPFTVEHLLTHTSGVKNYTSLPEWIPLWRKDMSLDELIALFKDQPMDFAPDEKWNYSNSGYVLLGAIIEKASGKPYAQFIQDEIFTPLGMVHTYYDETARIIPGRASGYQKGKDGYENAPYLSMTQPHAAGALASNVDDMARWDAALYTEKLVSQNLLKQAWTPHKLANGESTGYGFGWMMWNYEGHPVIAHGGGINGFLTDGLRLPEDGIYISLLTNTTTPRVSPDKVALQIMGLAIGKPYIDPEPVAVSPAVLETYSGVYELEKSLNLVVSVQDGQLMVQLPGSEPRPALAISGEEFYFKENLNRVGFQKDAKGKVTGVELRGPTGRLMSGKKIDKPLPADRPAIQLDPAVLGRYAGRYELAPGFVMEITCEDGKLMLQAPGQGKVELFAESERVLFFRAADAQAEFDFDPDGKVTGLVFMQGPQKLPARKLA